MKRIETFANSMVTGLFTFFKLNFLGDLCGASFAVAGWLAGFVPVAFVVGVVVFELSWAFDYDKYKFVSINYHEQRTAKINRTIFLTFLVYSIQEMGENSPVSEKRP